MRTLIVLPCNHMKPSTLDDDLELPHHARSTAEMHARPLHQMPNLNCAPHPNMWPLPGRDSDQRSTLHGHHVFQVWQAAAERAAHLLGARLLPKMPSSWDCNRSSEPLAPPLRRAWHRPRRSPSSYRCLL